MLSFRRVCVLFLVPSLTSADQQYRTLASYNHEVEKMAVDYDTSQFLWNRLCTCEQEYPRCDSNGWCYKDGDHQWSKSVCPGTCAAGYGVEIQHGIPKVNVTVALDDLGKLRRDAEQAVNESEAYRDWIFADATSAAYQDHQAEQIKILAFKAVDVARGKLEEHLYGQVTAVSALSAKLAGEPEGGTPEEQADLSKLLASVEKDRTALTQFGLGKKISEMHVITRLMERAEMDRYRHIRTQALDTRLAWLRGAKMATRLLSRWGRNGRYERQYDEDEETFDGMEQVTERKMDEAHDEIQNIYEGVHKLVDHRIELLKKAAKESSGPQSFLAYE